MKGARFYAYQVEGPRSPRHPFDADKILFDPYARALHFPPGFDRQAAIGPGTNAGRAPLGLIAADREWFDWANDRRPRHEADAVIYEVHVRGFTAHPSSGVADRKRGTFAGLIDKIPYLVDLGVTVVELMPVFQFDPGEGNYWGRVPLRPGFGFVRRSDGSLSYEDPPIFGDIASDPDLAGLRLIAEP
jgi:glycogen operon protein